MTLGLWTDPNRPQAWNRLTTPVAYSTSIPNDPFIEIATRLNLQGQKINDWRGYEYNTWYGTGTNAVKLRARSIFWHMYSSGPSRRAGTPYFYAMATGNQPPTNIYDATNGTTSYGQIIRTNRGIYDGSTWPN